MIINQQVVKSISVSRIHFCNEVSYKIIFVHNWRKGNTGSPPQKQTLSTRGSKDVCMSNIVCGLQASGRRSRTNSESSTHSGGRERSNSAAKQASPPPPSIPEQPHKEEAKKVKKDSPKKVPTHTEVFRPFISAPTMSSTILFI